MWSEPCSLASPLLRRTGCFSCLPTWSNTAPALEFKKLVLPSLSPFFHSQEPPGLQILALTPSSPTCLPAPQHTMDSQDTGDSWCRSWLSKWRVCGVGPGHQPCPLPLPSQESLSDGLTAPSPGLSPSWSSLAWFSPPTS